MIEQARELAQRLRNAEVVLFSKDADTIDALVKEVEQYLSDWKACTAMNRKLLVEVERLKQEQAEPKSGCETCKYAGSASSQNPCNSCMDSPDFHSYTPDSPFCEKCGSAGVEQEQAEPYAWELFFVNGKSQGFTQDKGEAHEWGEYAVPVYRSAPKGQTELLRQALEALEDAGEYVEFELRDRQDLYKNYPNLAHKYRSEQESVDLVNKAIDAIKQHLGEV